MPLDLPCTMPKPVLRTHRAYSGFSIVFVYASSEVHRINPCEDTSVVGDSYDINSYIFAYQKYNLSYLSTTLNICLKLLSLPLPNNCLNTFGQASCKILLPGLVGLGDFQCLELVVIYLDGLYSHPHGQHECWGF
jgi:hypothetical protein